MDQDQLQEQELGQEQEQELGQEQEWMAAEGKSGGKVKKQECGKKDGLTVAPNKYGEWRGMDREHDASAPCRERIPKFVFRNASCQTLKKKLPVFGLSVFFPFPNLFLTPMTRLATHRPRRSIRCVRSHSAQCLFFFSSEVWGLR